MGIRVLSCVDCHKTLFEHQLAELKGCEYFACPLCGSSKFRVVEKELYCKKEVEEKMK